MCWRVSLPVDKTAETRGTPPRHMGGMHQLGEDLFDKSRGIELAEAQTRYGCWYADIVTFWRLIVRQRGGGPAG